MRQGTCSRPRTSAQVPATVAVWAPCADSIVRHVTVAAAAFLAARAADTELNLSQPFAVELPKFELPKIKLPELKLPTLGGKKGEKAAPAPKAEKLPRMNVTVRAGANVTSAAASAPTLDDLTGVKKDVVIGSGDGWKRFPSRRMPGANMSGWKEVAKEIGPKI